MQIKIIKRLLEARWLQDLAESRGWNFWKKFLLLRHDFSTRDKMQRVFRRDEDPYYCQSSPYELERLDGMAAMVSGRSYGRALEVGCAGGEFTRRLIPICRSIVAVDISTQALEKARQAVESPKVRWVKANARDWGPQERFDLIVAGEVLLYLGDPTKGPVFEKAFDEFNRKLISWLKPGGRLLLAHGFPSSEVRAIREDYARRLQRLGMVLVASQVVCEGPHDKMPTRCLLHLLERPAAP